MAERWHLRDRNFEAERQRHQIGRQTALEHPLLLPRSSATHKSDAPSAPEPIQATAKAAEKPPLDPLSLMLAGGPPSTPITPVVKESAAKEETKAVSSTSWTVRSAQILNDYQLSGNLRVVASFLSTSGDDLRPNSLSRSRQRLQQLETGREDVREISQKELTAQLERLYASLQAAWNNEERVLTLKLAVQVASVLGDMSVPAFYPSLFVQVTEVLDRFGRLVFERIKSKSEATSRTRSKLPVDFISADVSVEAKETCRNWFYKAACIRDLLPRLYIEMALLKCYRFLSDDEYPQTLGRLASIIRGIGDPLVGVYARCYLAKVGNEVAPTVKDYMSRTLLDYMFAFESFSKNGMERTLRRNGGMSVPDYLHLHSPAVGWLCECVGSTADQALLATVLQHFRQSCNNTMMLSHILKSFSAELYAAKASAVVILVKEATPSRVTQVQLLATLGRRLAESSPPSVQHASFWSDVWKVVSACDSFDDYMNDPEAIRDLEHLVMILVQRSREFGTAVLTSDHLMSLLDVFETSKKMEIYKNILGNFGAAEAATTNDPIFIHTILDIARTLHDSLDSLSPEGERRHISQLICAFAVKIDFGRDLEQQLNVYAEARAAFVNLDSVLDCLCILVSTLAMKAHMYVKARHTKRTAGFVKACMAYCYITIPSIDDPMRKLQLLLHCGSVSLCNGCLPQTDSFFKIAISMIPELPTQVPAAGEASRVVHTEEQLFGFLTNFMSALICCPGHPRKNDPFYLLQGLLNALERFEWQESTPFQTRTYIHLLSLLSAYKQEKLPFSIAHVESNDVLYARSEQYLAQLGDVTSRVMGIIVERLTALKHDGSEGARKTLAMLALELAEQLLVVMEPSAQLGSFVANLVGLAKGAGRSARFQSTLDVVRRYRQDVGATAADEALQPLARLLAAEAE